MDLSTISWSEIAPFFLVGFLAQLVDGLLGMGFGVLTNTALVLMGIPPAASAAAVRTAESFASGVSGVSHALRRNVDWPLFARLVVPGVIGGVLGSWLSVHMDETALRPVVFAYLGAVGIYLVWRAPRRPQTYRPLRMVAPVGLLGALVDATGGGWGPIVTGNLLAQGGNPRSVIGTVNAAEFFVTVTVLSTFIGTLGAQSFTMATIGLLAGGIVAAPVGAVLIGRVPPRSLMTLVGIFLIASSAYGVLALAVEQVPAFPGF